ncbi:hypothetical protein PUN28_000628 [Cardiocondyla obscurior]|uniref:Uncharacterized protein n=1 Tax=Cardiocondyla obscurior TaxID=286306 RepID=A0AAW2H0C2_9HYME
MDSSSIDTRTRRGVRTRHKGAADCIYPDGGERGGGVFDAKATGGNGSQKGRGGADWYGRGCGSRTITFRSAPR